jgi:hypothetical protein
LGGSTGEPESGSGLVSGALVAEDTLDGGVLDRSGSEVPGDGGQCLVNRRERHYPLSSGSCEVAGDETALSVGINVRAFRARLLIVTSLITGVMVSVAGGIAFVGLVVPHMVRLTVGPNHRRTLPVSAILGAIFLVLLRRSRSGSMAR